MTFIFHSTDYILNAHSIHQFAIAPEHVIYTYKIQQAAAHM